MNAKYAGQRVVIITGCSSGFGYLASLAFARQGWYVCATMRDLSKKNQLVEIAQKEGLCLNTKRIDVNNEESVISAVNELNSETGCIDVLINNAGYALIGAVEDLTMGQIKEQFETNFFGSVRMIKVLMPIFRRQQHGHIINVTSVAGLVGMPLYGAYCASKYALEGLSEAMRFEAKLYNIRISNIEPGSFDTKFAKNSVKFGIGAKENSSPYRKLNDYFIKRAQNTTFLDPKYVVDLMIQIADRKSSKFWNPIGLKVRETILFKRLFGIDTAQKIMKLLMKVPI